MGTRKRLTRALLDLWDFDVNLLVCRIAPTHPNLSALHFAQAPAQGTVILRENLKPTGGDEPTDVQTGGIIAVGVLTAAVLLAQVRYSHHNCNCFL